MSPERWKRIEAVYESALEQTPESRAAYIGAACAGDDELRREVEALLRQENVAGPLDGAAWDGSGGRRPSKLAPGSQLGPYRIEAYLGAGGMGSVYRATDTRLGRRVAIKIAGERFTERFHKEARAIAALNHPHVCTLHDVGADFLVMEHVEGETLAERLRKGPLPVESVLRHGAQIAGALAAAHARGIVHRDLKPANVMITPAGVKLLDFGLAKMVHAEPAGDSTETNTADGVILGTLPYMAPEQIEGQECTPRTDIFALGLTLYEMATGKRAFRGESRASLTAEILRGEPPPVSSVQPAVPAHLEHIIRRCMAKEPSARWQSAADVEAELEWVGESQTKPVTAPGQKRWTQWVLGIAGLLAILVALAAGNAWSGRTAARTVRFWINMPESLHRGQAGISEVVVSPDGRRVVVIVKDGAGTRFVGIRNLDSFSTQRLEQTEGATWPFWSPDGNFIGFFADGKLKKISAGGGQAQSICPAERARGGTWSRDGTIIFAVVPATGRLSAQFSVIPSEDSLLFSVSSAGGVPVPLAPLDKAHGEALQGWPEFLPDGEHFLYLSQNVNPEQTGIYVQHVRSKDRYAKEPHSGELCRAGLSSLCSE